MYENYKKLALRILEISVYDFRYKMGSKKFKNKNKVIEEFLSINRLWFEAAEVNREWYYENTLKGIKYEESTKGN